jgi:secreted PhoX family phosphatase
VQRREFLRGGAAAGVLALGGSLWRAAAVGALDGGLAEGAAAEQMARRADVDGVVSNIPGGYGRLRAPDANGIRLPSGFRSRVIARTGDPVAGTGHRWHTDPDGGVVFPAGDGWIYVSNAETPHRAGGAGAIRFGPSGEVEDAYTILSGTDMNCAGGPTPWGTWLSCEEWSRGMVWECDPRARFRAEPRPAMGRFTHEAAAADPDRRVIYLTEDREDGCFYRFRPQVWGSLDAGSLEVLCGVAGVPTHWAAVPDPLATTVSTRHQVPGALRFNGGEGAWYDSGTCWFTTKGDDRVWAFHAPTRTLTVLYDARARSTAPLTGVDNITMSPGRRLFVAEDGGNMQICSVSLAGRASVFCRVVDQPMSELTGVAFDPSGTRLYFSSQRGPDGRGITYEVTGPF